MGLYTAMREEKVKQEGCSEHELSVEAVSLQPPTVSNKRLPLAGRRNCTTLMIVVIVYGKLHKQAFAAASCPLSACAGMLSVKVSWWSSKAAQWAGSRHCYLRLNY